MPINRIWNVKCRDVHSLHFLRWTLEEKHEDRSIQRAEEGGSNVPGAAEAEKLKNLVSAFKLLEK